DVLPRGRLVHGGGPLGWVLRAGDPADKQRHAGEQQCGDREAGHDAHARSMHQLGERRWAPPGQVAGELLQWGVVGSTSTPPFPCATAMSSRPSPSRSCTTRPIATPSTGSLVGGEKPALPSPSSTTTWLSRSRDITRSRLPSRSMSAANAPLA